MAVGLKLAPASLGLCARCGGAMTRRFDSAELLAPGAIVIGALGRLVWPWRAAVSDCGPWAHGAFSRQDTPP